MPSLPLTRFVIPCYNHGRFVADAVRSCLDQREAQVEVVVVNDGSTDNESAQACEKCADLGENVWVIHQENRGLPAARNVGALLDTKNAASDATPEYLVFLDADDYVEDSFVKTLAEQLIGSSPQVSHAYCQERLVDKATGIWTVPEWDPVLLMVTNIHPVTALIKASHFKQVGGFDETLIHGYEDWDLWLRFCTLGWSGKRIREPLFNWRRHSETTMAMQAAKNHANLHAALAERHAELFSRHAREIISLSNNLLRRADANWTDENGDAIYIRDLRSRNCELFDELAIANSRIVELKDTINQYEKKPSVRLSRAFFERLDALPKPLSEPLKVVVRLAKGIIASK